MNPTTEGTEMAHRYFTHEELVATIGKQPEYSDVAALALISAAARTSHSTAEERMADIDAILAAHGDLLARERAATKARIAAQS